MNASRPLRPFLLLALALAVAAPAAAQSVRKVDPQHVSEYWILLNQKVDIDIPYGGHNLDKPGCAVVTYTIGSDGVPRDLSAAKVVPDGDFGQVAISAVSNFRYGPTLANRTSAPVATYYIVPFNSPAGPGGQQQVMAPCKLTGYGTD